jgi:hypothetical protein
MEAVNTTFVPLVRRDTLIARQQSQIQYFFAIILSLFQ